MMKERLARLGKAMEQELQEDILPWWMKYTPDHEFGGFHGHITHENQAVERAGKGAILNTRILWTFAAAYKKYHNQDYLDTAQRAYRYILEHFLDREYGGVYWELDYRGDVISSRKQIYAIAFAIYALAEYHAACGDKDALAMAISLFRDIEDHALDREKLGYWEALSREWEPMEDLRLSAKDQNESKTMNTHLHIMEAYTNLYRTWKDPGLKKALGDLMVLFLEKFIDPVTLHLNLFFDDDWNLKSSLVSYGHDIECAWLLHEAAEVLDDRRMVEQTGRLAVDMARENFKGLDSDGGLYYEFFPLENKLDTTRHWWPQAEAVVGYLNAYQLSGEEEFFFRALSSWQFIENQLLDKNLGEWYWGVDKNGNPQTDIEKAGFWKCPYHNSRACLEVIRRTEETIKAEEK
ncbi:MAG: AGE family epimerase/isomerase [Bacteroidota bacterium]